MFEAETWRKMEVEDILSSIDAAVFVLEEKGIKDHLFRIAYLAASLNLLLAEYLDVQEAYVLK